MLLNIYTAVTVLGFIFLAIWVHRMVSIANKRWDTAFRIRYTELLKILPPSDALPAVLQIMSFPMVGAGSSFNNSRDTRGIIYIKDGHVIVELVGSQDAEPFYKAYPQIDTPTNMLEFRTAHPEDTFPGRGSYVLQPTGGQGKLCLIGEFVNTPAGLRNGIDILEFDKYPEGQQAIFNSLNEAGVSIRHAA